MRSPELKNVEKPKEHRSCSMVDTKHHCNTQHAQYFWLPDLSPELEKPKTASGVLMAAINNH